MKNQQIKHWLITFLLVSAFSFTCNAQKAARIIKDSTNNEHLPPDYYESMPSFPGGDEKLFEHFKKNINYPLEDRVKGIEGKVIVGFTVTKTGKLKDFKILRGLSKQIDEEAIRVVSTLPDFIPGTFANGKPADIEYILPVVFKNEPTKNIYEVVEEMPQFPGGDAALMDFFARNIKFTDVMEVMGRVVVRFIVNKNGKISNVEILRPLCPPCDNEAIRVIKLFPNWIPGKHKGKNVNVYYTLPVGFTMH